MHWIRGVSYAHTPFTSASGNGKMDKSVVNCWKDRIAVWSMVRTNCDMMCDFIDGLIRRLSGWMVFGGVENFFLS